MCRAFLFALVLASQVVHAQTTMGTTGTVITQQQPQIVVQPVQTPVITNTQPGTRTVIPTEPALLQLAPTPTTAAQAPAPAADAAQDKNDFQDFINQSTGQKLPLYGYDLFRRPPSTFAPLENVPVTPDYMIGPGDELMIRAWGQIDIDYRAIVDRNGAINIPRVGTIQVAGLKYQDIGAAVKKAVSKNFRNFELLVTLGQLRSIQIFVVGQAARPGSYTVSSLSTLVNALFAAGGPSARGSMRSIQLKRGTQVVTEFDMYDLLLRGDKSKDAPLLPGDVIYFPPSGPLTAVSGNVKNPAIYELKGPASVITLIDYAGGLTTLAQTKTVTIERIENRDRRVVDQFTLDAGGMARTVKDGDLVSLYPISPRFENAVTLRGHVALPLRFPFREGMRVRDMIPDKEVLITSDYFHRKNQAVRQEAVETGELAASVRKLADEINWDYAVVERLNREDLSTTLIPFNLGKVVLEGDTAQNIALKPGDVVTVFSKGDVRAPAQRRAIVVSLEGEFNNAGVYQALQGETLRQLVMRVGGVTPQAYVFGAEFTRESTKKQQEERLRQAIFQYEQNLQRAAATRARNVSSAEDAQSLKAEADAQQSILARLKRLQPTGRIVLEVPENDASIASLPELPLEDGDRLVMPQRPAMVTVFGSVYVESAFMHKPDKTVSDYLEQAGGARVEADRNNMFVLRADGSVIPNEGSWWKSGRLGGARLQPGDAIIVPEDLYRTTWAKDLKDWTQILYQLGLGAAAIHVLQQ
jgi:protein involved in polysaccharide export with SLBB domain